MRPSRRPQFLVSTGLSVLLARARHVRLRAHTGEYGRWSFGPDDYTTTDDAREFYYDPRAISPFNNRPGRCVPAGRGVRYVGASWPAKAPDVPTPPAVAP